jgi:transposase, IS30 family
MQHLTRSKREQLEALRRAGLPQTKIAEILGCHQSTVSRELTRSHPPFLQRYDASMAQKRAEGRRRRERHWHDDPGVLGFVLELLRQRQSPEQIEGRMKRSSPWHRAHSVSAKTIYAWIWKNQAEGGCLYLHLRRRGRRPKWFGMSKAGRTLIPHRRDISQRPKIVDRRNRCGDWESDLVVSPRSGRGAVATFVELINNRPRRSLNFRTPKEVLDAEIKRYAFEGSE